MEKLLSLLMLLLLFACQSESQKRLSSQQIPGIIELITPQGQSIETNLVIKWKDQKKGLSGVKSEDFAENQGMLFFNLEDDERSFWMPNTYFDLDLFFLDKDFKVIDIVRKLPHFKGDDPSLVPRARSVWARHVLEMKSSSPIAATIKINDQLKWNSEMSSQKVFELAQKDGQY